MRERAHSSQRRDEVKTKAKPNPRGWRRSYMIDRILVLGTRTALYGRKISLPRLSQRRRIPATQGTLAPCGQNHVRCAWLAEEAIVGRISASSSCDVLSPSKAANEVRGCWVKVARRGCKLGCGGGKGLESGAGFRSAKDGCGD